MKSGTETNLNPLCSLEGKPSWAHLIRLAGDRTAILFQELRRRIARIDGLQEELHDHGSEWGWGPRYRLGERILFSARLLPGRLEAKIELEGALKEKILASRKIAGHLKEAMGSAVTSAETTELLIDLSNLPLARSFAQLVIMKSRFGHRQRAAT